MYKRQGGENEDDAAAVLPLDAQLPDEGVGDARAHPAEEAREGREERGVLKAGLHDAEAPQEGHQMGRRDRAVAVAEGFPT